MSKTLLTVSALMAVAATAGAQSASAIRLRLDPASEVTIDGTSSLHAFHCKTNKINAYVDVDPGYTKDLTKVARPIVSVKVNIVVRTLTCGNGQMDKNMYGTLDADKNPLIKYTMLGYDILDGSRVVRAMSDPDQLIRISSDRGSPGSNETGSSRVAVVEALELLREGRAPLKLESVVTNRLVLRRFKDIDAALVLRTVVLHLDPGRSR